MRRRALTLALPILALVLPACATGGGSTGQRSRDTLNRISQEEIARSTATDALELIRQLRPRWLRSRGTMSFEREEAGYARVVIDGLPPRSLDALQAVPTVAILEIRYLDAREATMLYGTGFPGGVIAITTKRGKQQTP